MGYRPERRDERAGNAMNEPHEVYGVNMAGGSARRIPRGIGIEISALMLAATFLFSASAHGGAQTASPASKQPGASGVTSSDQEIIGTLQLAYRWGYPLLAMATNNTVVYGPTTNAFYNMKSAADDKARSSPGFNAETLYSAGALDLSAEPLVLTIPKLDDRFYVFPVQDAWGNISAVVGTRTEGNNGGSYLISGPGWTGPVPQGMKHFKSHTTIAFIPGRTMVRSPEDAKKVADTIQDHYTLTPLSRWGTGAPNRNRDSLKEPLSLDASKNYNTILINTSINNFFNKLNELLVKNPPYEYDKPVLDRFAKLGIGAGLKFDINKFSPAVRTAIEEFGRTDAPATQKLYREQGMNDYHRKVLCRFGTAYFERYYLLFGGLGGNLTDDAIYITLARDEDGSKLDGAHRYVVRFEPGQLPKARAFWSLTLYDKDFFLAKDMPMNRHVLNNNSGMTMNDDGSLEIYLQADSPGAGKESNWLPTPRDEYFTILRVYWPEEAMLSGGWHEPKVRKVR